MLSLMTPVGLYSLSLSFCVISIYWYGPEFPKIIVFISLTNSLKAYSWKRKKKKKIKVIKCLWETRPVHDVKMYREGRAVCPHPGCKPHNCHILNTHRTRLQQCHFECLIMTSFYFCMYISLYRRLCLHVILCCKYFILSSVILPLNVQGTTGGSRTLHSHTCTTYEILIVLKSFMYFT